MNTPLPSPLSPEPKSVALPEQPVTLPPEQAMTMLDHLAELRRRVIVSVVTFLIGITVAFLGALDIIGLLKHLAPADVVFVQLSPGEVLMGSVRLSVMLGSALASPVILYQVLRFVMPGLKNREKAYLIGAVVGGAFLFVFGVVFAYFAVVPSALTYLFDFGQSVAQMQLSIEKYIAFCTSLLLLTGVMFELPLLLFLLSFAGFVTSQRLLAEWRWAIIGIFLAAALITPSQDPFTMTIVGVAMVLLYFLSVIPIRLVGR